MAAPPAFAAWLLESLRSGLVAVDDRERIVAVSSDAARLLVGPDADPDALLARPMEEALAAQPRVRALLREALRGHEPPSRAELALEPGDGERRTVGFTLVPVRDPWGRLRGAAMLFRDLTPYERMDEQERLRDRLAALGQMAAGMAHEIRNPLAGMEVAAGLLKRRLGDRPEELELVEELLEETRRLAATVTASLEFVRPLALRRAPFDPAALARGAVRRARARVPFDGVVELDVPEALPRVEGDADQLGRVLVNLIVNAFQAMEAHPRPEGHRLRVAVRARADELVLEVSDTGPGVPDALRERIFYPFFTTREDGSGVGLAEVQKIVASHGGVLDMVPREGGGSVFRVHLPPAVAVASEAMS